MTRYIGLLRAVNLPGHNQVPMLALRELLTRIGFKEPRTLLQSGNVVFGCTRRRAADLESMLETELERRVKVTTDFFVRSAEEWQDIVARNSFPREAERDPGRLVMMVLKDGPSAQAVQDLQAAITGSEVVRVEGRHAYIVYPDGIGRSRLTNALIEKTLRTRGTGRNWNTVLKLNALVSAILLLVCVSRAVAAQAAPHTDDLLRIAEAFRLAGVVQTSVWPGWNTNPFPVLLVSGDREFLVASRNVPAGFTPTGYSMLLQANIWSRPRQFEPGLLATFPAFGPPPVVVTGRAEVTGKRSVAWVLTLLHEHFHQYQMSEPGYYTEVEQLGLSEGDQTGMWMLNYPFPYESPKVAGTFASVSRELGRLLVKSSPPERRRFWRTHAGFLDLLSERDRRYLSFQVWQEGVARYVELRVAELASQTYKPSLEFRQLPDVEPFAKTADSMRASILSELAAPDLAKQKRVGFYAFGAGLALLLDQDGSAWKSRYMKEKFFLGGK